MEEIDARFLPAQLEERHQRELLDNPAAVGRQFADELLKAIREQLCKTFDKQGEGEPRTS
jgi:hypothetical protein